MDCIMKVAAMTSQCCVGQLLAVAEDNVVSQEGTLKTKGSAGEGQQAAMEARHLGGLDKGFPRLVQSQSCQLAAGNAHQRQL